MCILAVSSFSSLINVAFIIVSLFSLYAVHTTPLEDTRVKRAVLVGCWVLLVGSIILLLERLAS